jgi:hypothetical protein
MEAAADAAEEESGTPTSTLVVEFGALLKGDFL